MAVKRLERHRVTVELPDGDSFTVRGLDLVDITAFAMKHRLELPAMFARFKEIDDSGVLVTTLNDPSSALYNILVCVPNVLVQIIGIGAGEDDLDLVRMLPIGTQIEAVEKIAKLTVASFSVQKILQAIVRVMNGTAGAISTPSQPRFRASAPRQYSRFQQFHR